MQQNSDEWLAFRKNKIGASDANIIMGVSEHMTPLDLYLEKKDLPPRRKQTDSSFIFDKGHYLEDKIRAEIELETRCEFPPNICIHAQIDYLMASMDGYNAHWKMGIEAKYVGQEMFSKILNWNPESNEPFPAPQFYPQIQQQYLCSGAEKMAVVAITEQVEMEQKECIGGPNDFIMVPKKVDNKLVYILNEHGKKTYKKVIKHVPLNMDYINNELLPAVINFQKNYIELNVEPDSGDADIIEIKNIDIGKKVTEYKKNQMKIFVLKDKIKPLDAIAVKLKAEIFKFEMVSQPKMSCKGVSITQTVKDGTIDYESAFKSLKDNLEMVTFGLSNYETMADIEAALKDVFNLGLENFKSANKTTYTIKVTKDKKEKKEQESASQTMKNSIENKTVDVDITIEETPKGIPAAEITPENKTNTKTTLANNSTAWANMTADQQRIQGESNGFKTEKGKVPKDWINKSINERIEYLEKYSKRSSTSASMRLISSKLANDLKTLN